jgi:uncharacterized protein YndB with AHSA1/START domain
MKAQPLVKEVTINAPVPRVWKAITDKDEMKNWYFDLEKFEARAGFEFQFSGGTEERQYLHLCKIKEVIHEKKLSYSWKYENDPGISIVTFELFPEGNSTRLKLTHEGLENFSQENPDFARENFVTGWNEIIGKSIKEYLEKSNKI